MSVVVRMEMPSCCHDCPFEADQWDYPICRVTGRSEGYRFDARNNRMVDCPIVCSLPEGHGDLIDRDSMVEEWVDEKIGNPHADYEADDVIYDLKKRTVIVPKDKAHEP